MAINNKKAYFNYTISQTLEAGIELLGCEVKSIRLGHMTIHESYVRIIKSEVFLINSNILPYAQGNRQNPTQNRDRKLLLNRREISQLEAKVEQKGFILVPTKVYFKKNRVKIEIGVGKPKKYHDKRAHIKEREQKREIDRGSKGR